MRGHPAHPAPDSQPSSGAQAVPEKAGFMRSHGRSHMGRQHHGRRRRGGARLPSLGPAAAPQPRSRLDRARSEGLLPTLSWPGRQWGDCGWAGASLATIVLTGNARGTPSWHGSPGPRSPTGDEAGQQGVCGTQRSGTAHPPT